MLSTVQQQEEEEENKKRVVDDLIASFDIVCDETNIEFSIIETGMTNAITRGGVAVNESANSTR